MKKILVFIIIITITQAVFANEKDDYTAITKLSAQKKKTELKKSIADFRKKYPNSTYKPDISMIEGDNITDPDAALIKYRAIVAGYPNYSGRELAQKRVCEILELESNWNELYLEANKSIKLFPKGAYINYFKIMLIKSSLATGSLKITEAECENLLGQKLSVDDECLVLKYQSKLLKRKYGYSNNYFYILSKLWTAALNTENMPATIFLLGDYYQNVEDYDKAWSAYSDCVKKYPQSPEAKTASVKIKELTKYAPEKVAYAPAVDILKSPQDNGKKQSMTKNTYYSVMIGPFKDIKQANRIKKLLDIDDFQKIFKSNNQFHICIGRSNKINVITDIKIRLAEEFEMMGEIVKIESTNNTFYIYEVD